MPSYEGEVLRLFRGADALSDDGRPTASRGRRACQWPRSLRRAIAAGRAVVLETVAPSEAIIAAVEYPSPPARSRTHHGPNGASRASSFGADLAPVVSGV